MTFYDLVNKNIIELLNLEFLDEDKKVDLLERISDFIQKKIIIRIIEFLEEKEVEELADLLAGDNNEEIMQFLDKKVPTLEEIIWQEVNSFKEESYDLLKA